MQQNNLNILSQMLLFELENKVIGLECCVYLLSDME